MLNSINIGRQLRDSDVPLAELAAASGYAAEEIEDWQFNGHIPRHARHAIAMVLWDFRVRRAVADPDCPACPWWDTLPEYEMLSPEAIEHEQSCVTCRDRNSFVRRTAGDRPDLGVKDRILLIIDNLPGMWRAAGYGAALITMLGGPGLIAIPLVAVQSRDLRFLMAAPALLLLTVISGGIGGLAYHATAPMRRRGSAGRYASSMLAAAAYLIAVAVLVGGAVFVGSSSSERGEMIVAVTDPVNLILGSLTLLVTAAIAGATLARQLSHTWVWSVQARTRSS